MPQRRNPIRTFPDWEARRGNPGEGVVLSGYNEAGAQGVQTWYTQHTGEMGLGKRSGSMLCTFLKAGEVGLFIIYPRIRGGQKNDWEAGRRMAWNRGKWEGGKKIRRQEQESS